MIRLKGEFGVANTMNDGRRSVSEVLIVIGRYEWVEI